MKFLTYKNSFYLVEVHLQPVICVVGILFLWSVIEQVLAKAQTPHLGPESNANPDLSLIWEAGDTPHPPILSLVEQLELGD